ncbi:MAG: hypothetical protein QG623_621 [Patescibacteria group bacterium]|nr:hypothetical protein [Patescibacteria group bacterium]
MINSPESNGLKSIDKANDVYEATGLWWAGTIDRTPELNFPLTAPIADLTELDFIMESKNRQRALI